MASRINAEGAAITPITNQNGSWMTQFAMNWGLVIGTLLVALPSTLSVTLTNDVDTEMVENELKQVGEMLEKAPDAEDEEKQVVPEAETTTLEA